MKPETVTITGILVEIGPVRQHGRFTTRTIVVNDDDSPNQQRPSLVSIDVEDGRLLKMVESTRPLEHVSVDFLVRGVEFTGRDGQRRRFNKLIATFIQDAGRLRATSDEPVGYPPPPSPDIEGEMPF